jgi:hypothetical protein
MGGTTAQQVFRELDSGKWRPNYLIVGEEEFQIGDIVDRLKRFFLKDASSRDFNFESWARSSDIGVKPSQPSDNSGQASGVLER